MSMFESKGTLRTAGSRFITYGGAVVSGACVCCVWRWELMRCMKVVLPDPAMPTQTIETGGCFCWAPAPAAVLDEAMIDEDGGVGWVLVGSKGRVGKSKELFVRSCCVLRY